MVQNGAERVPKATEMEPKGSQNEPRGPTKDPLRKSIDFDAKKDERSNSFWEPFGSIFGQNPLKNDVEKTSKKQMSKIPVFIRFGLRK